MERLGLRYVPCGNVFGSFGRCDDSKLEALEHKFSEQLFKLRAEFETKLLAFSTSGMASDARALEFESKINSWAHCNRVDEDMKFKDF